MEWIKERWRRASTVPLTRPRTILRARTMSSLNFKIEKTIGWKIRDAVGFIENLIGPYLKYIFPNFVSAHYFYIIFMTFLASVIIYPHDDISYINALFISACAVTQAGLNPIDINSLMLYQQIVIYVFCTLTTPIFIHSFLAFLRLYWFERHFDNIRETSKLNYRMRRTATLAARTQSMERFRTAEREHELDHLNNVSSTGIRESLNHQFASNSVDSINSSSNKSDQSLPHSFSPAPAHSNGVDHISEPSSDEEDTPRVAPDDLNMNHPNIKFAELPKPAKHVVEPRDVMMSVSMLNNNQQNNYDEEEGQGPALVITGPAEREKKKHHRFSRPKNERQTSIHFDIKPEKPQKKLKKKKFRKRSFLFKHSDNSDADGDDEADDNDDDDDDNDVTRNSEIVPQVEQQNGITPIRTAETTSEKNGIERSTTHVNFPNIKKPDALKFGKRSNTLDILRTKSSFLSRSPTFDKFVKKSNKSLRRTFSYADDSEAIQDDSNSETDPDDEEESPEFGLRRQMSANYLSWVPKIGRNSTFVDLSDRQKEELGGVEYRAVKLLTRVLVGYYVGFHILAVVFLVPWILKTKTYQAPVTESGVSLTWWGFFTSMSSFNDLGYTLTPDSMIQFNTSVYTLIVSGFFIIIGNTGFPILLRFIIWIMFKFSSELSLFKESLGFLLDHPRRCFTLLFPSSPTWWLLFILVTLNVVDLVLFIILDIGAAVLDGLTNGQKVLDGLYQAISTRTAGFAIVDLSLLHPAVQVSYMVMMYISVLPLAISIRRTNVYEEQSLGVYMGAKNDENDEHHDPNEPTDNSKPTSFIGAHLRKQLSFDLWFVFLGLFIICIAEGTRISDPNLPQFNVFQVMFEVVSAYGTVGLSLGYPNSTASFSAQFNTISKLVIIAMVIRGRHRGLPYSLDRAIMLPSDKMDDRDRYQDLHAGHTLAKSETLPEEEDPVVEFFKGAAPKFVRDKLKRPSFMSTKSTASLFRRGSRSGSSSSQHHRRPSSVGNFHNNFDEIDEVEEGTPDIDHVLNEPVTTYQVNGRNDLNNYQLNSPSDGSISPNTISSPKEDVELDYFNTPHHSVRGNSTSK